MNKKFVAIALIFGLLAAGAGYKLLSQREQGLTATGTIEITRADITAKTSGYLSDLQIREGDAVAAGQKVARVVRKDLEAQVLRDEAALYKAQAQLKDLEKGARSQELSEAAASLAAAEATYDKNRTDYERFAVLFREGAISAQQLDAAKSAYQVAYNALAAAKSRYSLLEEGSRPDAIEAQRLEVERSRAIVEASKALMADTVIVSPLAGIVLTKNFEDGEFVNAGSPVATVGNMQDCWVKVYVPSTELGHIKAGQTAAVKIDSFPDRTFLGTVAEISQKAEFTPRQSITAKERANLVFAVKVRVENPENVLKPGMPADVVFR